MKMRVKPRSHSDQYAPDPECDRFRAWFEQQGAVHDDTLGRFKGPAVHDYQFRGREFLVSQHLDRPFEVRVVIEGNNSWIACVPVARGKPVADLKEALLALEGPGDG